MEIEIGGNISFSFEILLNIILSFILQLHNVLKVFKPLFMNLTKVQLYSHNEIFKKYSFLLSFKIISVFTSVL